MPSSNPLFHNNPPLSISLVPVLCSLSYSTPLLLSGVPYNADNAWWKRERATWNKDRRHRIRTAFPDAPSVSRLQLEVSLRTWISINVYTRNRPFWKPRWPESVTLDYCDECRKVKGWEFLSDEHSCCSCQVPFKEAVEGFGGQRGWQPGQKVTFEFQVKKSKEKFKEIRANRSCRTSSITDLMRPWPWKKNPCLNFESFTSLKNIPVILHTKKILKQADWTIQILKYL